MMAFYTKKQLEQLREHGKKGAEHGAKSLINHDAAFYAAAARKGIAKRWPNKQKGEEKPPIK